MSSDRNLHVDEFLFYESIIATICESLDTLDELEAKAAKDVVLAEKPVISDDSNQLDSSLLYELLANIATLSSALPPAAAPAPVPDLLDLMGLDGGNDNVIVRVDQPTIPAGCHRGPSCFCASPYFYKYNPLKIDNQDKFDWNFEHVRTHQVSWCKDMSL